MRRSISLLVIGLTACAGKAPPSSGATPDAGTVVDAPPVQTAAMLSGKAMDYFGGQAAANLMLATDGIDPPAQATSGTDGSFQLQVAVGSKLFVVVSGTNYRPTRSIPISVADMPVTQDVYGITDQDVKRQYITLGKTPTTGTAFLAAELQKNDGTPLEGIPLANIQLLDANNQPVTGVLGPYFFGTAGDIDPALATATAYGTPPRSRVAFLDVPPGSYTLAVTYPDGAGGGNIQNNTLVSTAADGATLALSGGVPPGMGSGMGSGSGSGSGSATDPSFETDIYPRLQRAAQGGLGCANCHTANGPAAVLPYDDAPATVLANMKALPGVIDLTTPASSLFLVKPLYEQPPAVQDHPNATFLDINDPDYKLFLLWITNGAKP